MRIGDIITYKGVDYEVYSLHPFRLIYKNEIILPWKLN